MQHSSSQFFSGTSGLVLPVPNKLHYPPEFQDKTRLTYYASLFSSIEINSSFYKVPRAATIAKWAAEVPPGFRFTFKLWQGITHTGGQFYAAADVERFMTAIDAVNDKKGCLLIQFPASVQVPYLPELQRLLAQLRELDSEKSWQLAVEFRHLSWYQPGIYELLEQFDAALVLQDKPPAITPMNVVESNAVYLRFHGPSGNYRGSYPDDVLAEYASYIREWQEEGKTVYVYFNNTTGDAVTNLLTMNDFVLH